MATLMRGEDQKRRVEAVAHALVERRDDLHTRKPDILSGADELDELALQRDELGESLRLRAHALRDESRRRLETRPHGGLEEPAQYPAQEVHRGLFLRLHATLPGIFDR